MNEIERAIADLEYLRAMMTFDQNTGEELNIENDNKDNQSLYKSAGIAIQALQSELDRQENKALTLSELKEMVGEPVWYDGKCKVISEIHSRNLKKDFYVFTDGSWYTDGAIYKHKPNGGK